MADPDDIDIDKTFDTSCRAASIADGMRRPTAGRGHCPGPGGSRGALG